MNVIEIEGLKKLYRSRKGDVAAIDGLAIAVAEGGVYGFLGPNGSGKTTTIRCLLGLVRPTAGSMHLLGRPVPRGLPVSLRSVGAIVEAPALFLTSSGRENLRQFAAADGISHARVEMLLEEVGLAERASQSVRKYSLGMRQRLALAAALLKDPPLLILDEPANGLDPAGIRQVRELLIRLGREGRTVFVSSHQLAEIEQTCDSVAIINKGKCITSGRVTDVLAASANATETVVGFDRNTDLSDAVSLLKRSGFVVHSGDAFLVISGRSQETSQVNRLLGENDLWPSEIRTVKRNLEDVFLDLTGTLDKISDSEDPIS